MFWFLFMVFIIRLGLESVFVNRSELHLFIKYIKFDIFYSLNMSYYNYLLLSLRVKVYD
jgi:hypothetical protein